MRAHSPPFVLTIESSLTLRTIIEVTLRRHFPSARGAFYAEAVAALQDIHAGRLPVPAVAVIRQDMPHLDGIAATRLMRARGYPTGIVLLLEHDCALERVKARLAGAQTSLAKPLTVQQLVQTLHAFPALRTRSPGER
ncbi:MAG TPA: response regulator [Ktedonobacteraceae bacterium]|nr:response regulator [Ktedonobacteraceae bacterium]